MVEMLATRMHDGDVFLGRMAFFSGRIGTLWPSGLPPQGTGVIYGRMGSGKSTALAINMICTHIGPMICMDTKGELAQAGFARRGGGSTKDAVIGLGQDAFVIDPLEISGLPRSRYNPLHEIAQEKDVDLALRLMYKLAEGMVKSPEGGGGENAWVHSGARGIDYGVIAFVVAFYPPETRNLVTVRRLLMQGDPDYCAALKAKGIKCGSDFDALLVKMQDPAMLKNHPFADVIAAQAANVARMGERQRGAVLSAISEATLWLDLPKFQDAVSDCNFLLSDFLTKRISVFVCLPLNELTGIAAGFTRFFLTMFLQQMIAKNPDRKPLPFGPALAIVDETPQYGVIDGLCSRVGPAMRDYHTRLVVLAQDAGQMVSCYGQAETDTLHGCASYVVVMAMTHGNTIDWLVRSLGEKLIRERQPDGRMMQRPYPLLDAEQARRYLKAGSGNIIVLRFDAKPLRLKAAPYHWFLPFWMYTPDPRHPEPFLRRKMRERAARKVAEAAKPKTARKQAK